MASVWSWWIIVLTVISFVGMTWILFANRTREQAADRTTGHVHDGIEEFDNPLPAWWFYMFLITIVFGAGYLVLYPGLGNFTGLLGWTQIKEHDRDVAAAEAQFREMRDRYLALPIEEIAGDPAVRKMGMRLFANNCAQCHGSDAGGAYGFPNLMDDDWIWGGEPEAIKASIVNGRIAAMPPWQAALGDQGIDEVTQYVLKLNGRVADEAKAAAGEKHYQTYCVACHGAEAQGNPLLGSPNLANGIWLYGGSPEQIAHSLRFGRNGQMPAYRDSLSEDKIHILAAYVYGLSQ